MAKLRYAALALSLTAMLLVACDTDPVDPPDDDGITYNDLNIASNYISSKDFYINADGLETYSTTYISGDPATIGEVAVFVLPVEFVDAPASELPGGAEYQIQQIEEAFFGDPETNPALTESLASYYEKSSYGQMHITGEVNDSWWNCGLTVDELAQIFEDDYNNGQSGSAPFRILRDFYRQKTGITDYGYITEEGYEWAMKYDKNNDGFIDCISMIYSCHSYPNMGSNLSAAYQETFWAFTHSDFYQAPWLDTGADVAYDGLPSKYAPQRYRFVWMSWDQIYYEGYYDDNHNFTGLSWTNPAEAAELSRIIASDDVRLDTHTIIHEHGHALCAYEDYYTYDNGDWYAAGWLDMMDHNLGDHNAYSKMLSQWISPTVVDEPGTYTLKSMQSGKDGVAILVKARGQEYRNTPLDEYILLELYTPDGLNALDSTESLNGIYPLLYTEVGVKVYHIDSRFGLFSYNDASSSYVFTRYTTALSMGDRQRTQIVASNTASRSAADSEFKLIHLLESSGQNSFEYGQHATNDTLFQAGDSFGVRTFQDFTMNSGDEFGWTFTIDSIENGVASITFAYAE